jgi:hypothetical protein
VKPPDADFRPRRRAGYVPSPPRRKIPLIRILLILVAGTLVYRHFDTFWKSGRSIAHAKDNAVGFQATWLFNEDSSRAVLNCARAKEAEYCTTLDKLQPGLCGETFAAMRKGVQLRILNHPALSSVEARRVDNAEGEKLFMVTSLQGRDHESSFKYRRAMTPPMSPWCDSARGCLVSRAPSLPLAKGKATSKEAEVWTSANPKVSPVLPGWIAEMDSSDATHHRVVLYHGNELYTSYEGLQNLTAKLQIGKHVDPDNPIGEAHGDSTAPDSSRYSLTFRVEQAGMPIDPGDFLARNEHGH